MKLFVWTPIIKGKLKGGIKAIWRGFKPDFEYIYVGFALLWRGVLDFLNISKYPEIK